MPGGAVQLPETDANGIKYGQSGGNDSAPALVGQAAASKNVAAASAARLRRTWRAPIPNTWHNV